jgi:RNA 2',3'-cyclic 3'-phosphodiesterase
MIRMFVALEIPDKIIKKILELRDAAAGNESKLNWEHKDKIHLTLKFIGEVPEEKVDLIKESLNFIEDFSKINLELTKFGFFFRKKEPKILWMGLKADKNLNILFEEIENNMLSLGIPKEERKFKPHLTLLRIKKPVRKKFIKNFEDYLFDRVSFNADSVALIKSELSAEGSKYTEIKKYKLKDLEEK